MRLGVLSDTHTDSIKDIPRRLLDELSRVDLIIHAGDFTGKSLLDDLRKIGQLRGVYGNIDGPEIRRELPSIDIIDVGGFRMGLNHPSEGGPPSTLEERLRRKFENVHVIIHGHSHQTKNELRNGVLFFNPGSATGTFPAMKKTFGILTVEKEVRGEIVLL